MANTPAYDRLLDNIRINLPGALDNIIQLELFNTFKDFCRYTKAWQECIPLDVTPASKCYNFSATGGDPEWLLGVWPPSNTQPDGTDPPSEISPGRPGPLPAIMPQPGVLHLQYAPNMEQTYNVVVSLTVTDPLTRTGLPIFPEWLLEKHQDALQEGTISRMMLQGSKPYTSKEGALFHGGVYRKLRNETRNAVNIGNVYGGQRWQFPQTFNKRRY